MSTAVEQYLRGDPERCERFQITLVLDKAKAELYAKEVESILDGSYMLHPGDVLRCKVEFDLEYFSGIVEKLLAVNQIAADKEVVLELNQKELTRGQCLLQETFLLLEELRKTLS